MFEKNIHVAIYNAKIALKAGHLNDVSLAGRWWPNIECWLGTFVLFQGIQTSIAKKSYIFAVFQGRGGGGLLTPCPPFGSAHEYDKNQFEISTQFQFWRMNIFLPIIFSNMYFECSKEPSHWDGYFEHSKHMFWFRNTKYQFWLLRIFM